MATPTILFPLHTAKWIASTSSGSMKYDRGPANGKGLIELNRSASLVEV